MGLTPSTLFHFTSKTGLKGILKDNFKLKYCKEELIRDKIKNNLGVPMVSFCDIKVSELKEHIGKYGSYGVGLSKSWARKNGLNPVIYLEKSDFSTKLIDRIFLIANIKGVSIDNLRIYDMFRFIKAYEGNLVRNKKTIKNYRFADEREWRYVPDVDSKKGFHPYLLPNEFDTPEKKKIENKKLENERLYFNPNDILYLIVKKESEIEDIIHHIRSVKSKDYTLKDVERLMTRIISCERIFEDF